MQALTEGESQSEEFNEILKANTQATKRQSDTATKSPSVSSFISERLAPAHIGRARKKVLTSYRFGIAGTVLATVFAGVVGPLHRAEACSFVRSDECAVRYLPVLFKCDVSIRSYFPRAGVSVHAAEAEQDTSIGGFAATFPTVVLSYAFVGISFFLFFILPFTAYVYAAKSTHSKEDRGQGAIRQIFCAWLPLGLYSGQLWIISLLYGTGIGSGLIFIYF